MIETDKKGEFVLVLDTEGLGAMDVNKKSDSRLFNHQINFYIHQNYTNCRFLFIKLYLFLK